MIDKGVQNFADMLTNAGFRDFTIRETNKPKTNKLLMNSEQEIRELKINFNKLQIRFTKAKQAYIDMRAERDEYKLLLEAKHTDNKKPKTKPKQNTDTDIVDEIYLAYPRKLDKKRSLSAISKAIIDFKRNGGTPSNLLSIVKEFSREVERHGINSKHESWSKIPHPSTWFNQARYELKAEEWTANFREGKYTTPDKVNTVPPEPPHWKKVIKVLYPDCLEHSLVWDTWFVNYPDLVVELRENYNRILKELNL